MKYVDEDGYPMIKKLSKEHHKALETKYKMKKFPFDNILKVCRFIYFSMVRGRLNRKSIENEKKRLENRITFEIWFLSQKNDKKEAVSWEVTFDTEKFIEHVWNQEEDPKFKASVYDLVKEKQFKILRFNSFKDTKLEFEHWGNWCLNV